VILMMTLHHREESTLTSFFLVRLYCPAVLTAVDLPQVRVCRALVAARLLRDCCRLNALPQAHGKQLETWNVKMKLWRQEGS
jgi:hypothetical protein